MGFIFGSGKKAAKIAAKATMDSARIQAASDRLVAQASQQSRETMIAQDLAAKKAEELLSKPQGQVDVMLAPENPAAEIDVATGKRRTTRSTYTAKTPTSGIRI